MLVQSKPQDKAFPRGTEFTAVKFAADVKKRRRKKRLGRATCCSPSHRIEASGAILLGPILR